MNTRDRIDRAQVVMATAQPVAIGQSSGDAAMSPGCALSPAPVRLPVHRWIWSPSAGLCVSAPPISSSTFTLNPCSVLFPLLRPAHSPWSVRWCPDGLAAPLRPRSRSSPRRPFRSPSPPRRCRSRSRQEPPTSHPLAPLEVGPHRPRRVVDPRPPAAVPEALISPSSGSRPIPTATPIR